MTREIIFATGNNGKVASLKRSFAVEGLDIAVLQQPLDLIEPQAHTAAEVAVVKANQAYALLGKPVLVDDSSFHISALGGFPGPYIKYMLETVGVEGIMSFMDGKEDRSAYFMSSLVFIDEDGEIHTFNGQDKKGVIVNEINSRDNTNAWSELWKKFAPSGYPKTYYLQSGSKKIKLLLVNNIRLVI